jgi:hypothetical protein
MRVGLWLSLGLPLAFLAIMLAAALADALDPSLPKGVSATTPHHLLVLCGQLAFVAFLCLAAALPLLGAARLAFQRPAWTFVSPARSFAPDLLAAGALVYVVLTAASVGVDLLAGARLAPPLLDRRQPELDRLVYGLAAAPLILLANAAQELLFRGVILQVVGAFIRTRVGLCVMNGLVSGLVMTILLPQPNPVLFLDLAVTGAVFAYSVLELGGLEFSLGAGFAGDFLLWLLHEPSTGGGKSAGFRWGDLLKADTLVEIGLIAAVALGTVAGVRLVKRLRKP